MYKRQARVIRDTKHFNKTNLNFVENFLQCFERSSEGKVTSEQITFVRTEYFKKQGVEELPGMVSRLDIQKSRMLIGRMASSVENSVYHGIKLNEKYQDMWDVKEEEEGKAKVAKKMKNFEEKATRVPTAAELRENRNSKTGSSLRDRVGGSLDD